MRTGSDNGHCVTFARSMRPRSALTSVSWHALVAHDRYGVWSQASPHLPLDLESLPCPPCGVGGQELTVREHDRHALLPDLVEVRRNSEPRSCRLCWWGPRVHREGPGDPRLVHIFVPTIGLWWQHRHALPPQRRLPGELVPLLLPGSVSIQRQDQLMHRARPVPAPALDTKIATTRDTPAASNASTSKAPSHTHRSPAPACSAAGCVSGACLGWAGGRRGSETAWLGWWHPILVAQVMQQPCRQLPR